MEEALKLIEKYVSMPSGSYDVEDVCALGDVIAADLQSLGMQVTVHKGSTLGNIVEATYGSGENVILLMGHMDTVFPRADFVPFRVEDGKIYGSGAMDMKGGLAIMHCGLKAAISSVDPEKNTIKVIINPDEELGSPSSHEIIYNTAAKANACLSFEPARPDGGLVCERKGVTSFILRSHGVRGHAGAAYLKCHSAIQEICAKITKLYTLRDDANDISINAGVISGGTADNVVCDFAEAKIEFRYFDMAFRDRMIEQIKEICAVPDVEGCWSEVEFGAAHPSAKMTPGSRKLFATAEAISAEIGRPIHHESTGGAGDIAIAASAGCPVLDGLGLEGYGAHTRSEYGLADKIAPAVELTRRMILALAK